MTTSRTLVRTSLISALFFCILMALVLVNGAMGRQDPGDESGVEPPALQSALAGTRSGANARAAAARGGQEGQNRHGGAVEERLHGEATARRRNVISAVARGKLV